MTKKDNLNKCLLEDVSLKGSMFLIYMFLIKP